MASTKKSLSARFAAGLGASAIATLTVFGGGLPASAATANLDPTPADGRSITIHKFAEPVTPMSTTAHDGSALDESDLQGLTALEGVVFSLEKVEGIDLNTTEGWAAAEALTVAQAEQNYTLTAVDSGPTNEFGALSFENLDAAIYLVKETGSGGHSIGIKTAPFLVTVPMPVNNTWVYNVHVYPKNSLTTISKKVDDSAALSLGNEVKWTITVDVPEVGENALTEFRITDTMDARLAFVSGSLVLSVPGDTETDPREEIALTLGTHFTVTNGPNYTITFTPDGRDLLAGLDEARIDIEVATKVVTIGTGSITNVAALVVNGTEFKTAPAETNWGTLSILKHAGADLDAVLADAEFQIFRSQSDAENLRDPITMMVDGKSVDTFTSSADGIAFVPGLKAGVTVYVVETLAPIGYQLDQRVQSHKIVAGDVERTSVDVWLSNDQVDAYMLPITGGSGQAAFMIGGFGLLAGALGFMLMRRRKAKAEAQA